MMPKSIEAEKCLYYACGSGIPASQECMDELSCSVILWCLSISSSSIAPTVANNVRFGQCQVHGVQ